MNVIKGEAARESHTGRGFNRIQSISNRLEDVAGRLENKLSDVMVPPTPTEDLNKKDGMIAPRRPALFDELHDNLDSLDRCVSVLNNIIDRVEL